MDEASIPPVLLWLYGISLTILPGDPVALIGENGAGKTTLVKHINGLLKPTAGRVMLDDLNTVVARSSVLAHQVGFVFQNPDDQIFMPTVQGEVGYGLRHIGIGGEEANDRVRRALEVTGLAGQEMVNPYDLSPAKRKMLAIASVLVMDQNIVIFDEPTMGQDLTGLERIGVILDRLKQLGKTVITISHNMDFCAEHFFRFIVMHQGKILWDGSGHEVFTRRDILKLGNIVPPQLVQLALKIGLPATVRSDEEFLLLLESSRR